MKPCTVCNKKKLFKFFNKRKRSKDGLTASCKDCLNKWQAENTDYYRHMRYDLKRYYNITIEFFKELLADQDGKCAICGASAPGGRGRWHVDHSHDTGKVRGLLCHKCNVGLGHFNDDAALLQKALNYLKGRKA